MRFNVTACEDTRVQRWLQRQLNDPFVAQARRSAVLGELRVVQVDRAEVGDLRGKILTTW